MTIRLADVDKDLRAKYWAGLSEYGTVAHFCNPDQFVSWCGTKVNPFRLTDDDWIVCGRCWRAHLADLRRRGVPA